jgi:hypothetical protein
VFTPGAVVDFVSCQQGRRKHFVLKTYKAAFSVVIFYDAVTQPVGRIKIIFSPHTFKTL